MSSIDQGFTKLRVRTGQTHTETDRHTDRRYRTPYHAARAAG